MSSVEFLNEDSYIRVHAFGEVVTQSTVIDKIGGGTLDEYPFHYTLVLEPNVELCTVIALKYSLCLKVTHKNFTYYLRELMIKKWGFYY